MDNFFCYLLISEIELNSEKRKTIKESTFAPDAVLVHTSDTFCKFSTCTHGFVRVSARTPM